MAEKTYFYIDDWNDEVLPCVPTLAGWAEWLAADITDEWGREGPVANGSEFTCGRLTDLGTITARKGEDGKWSAYDPVPQGTDTYFLRLGPGDSGWDADFSGDTLDEALTDIDEDEAEMACVRTDPDVRVRFDSSGDTPTLTVLGEVN